MERIGYTNEIRKLSKLFENRLKTLTISKKKIQESEVIKSLNTVNVLLKNMQREAKFSIDKESNRVVVKIVDKVRNEVIRQIPPEAILNLSREIGKLIGNFFDKII